MNYKHLTATVRGAIEVLLQENYTQEEIAGKLEVSEATISREIAKRGTPLGYFARVAQEHYERVRLNCRQKKKCLYSGRQKYIAKKLELGWSPEQIAGKLKKICSPLYVCSETIYQFLYTDKWAKDEEKLYQYLRYGRKKRKNRQEEEFTGIKYQTGYQSMRDLKSLTNVLNTATVRETVSSIKTKWQLTR